MRGLIDNVFQAFGVHDPVPFLLVAGGFLLGVLLAGALSWQRRRGAESERSRGGKATNRIAPSAPSADHHQDLQEVGEDRV